MQIPGVSYAKTIIARCSLADTYSSSLWNVPALLARSYWKKAAEGNYNEKNGHFVYPCDTKLPDITLMIGGAFNVTIPAANMNFSTFRRGSLFHGSFPDACVGGLSGNDRLPYIAGDTFLKGLFVAYHYGNNTYSPRLGFAPQRV